MAKPFTLKRLTEIEPIRVAAPVTRAFEAGPQGLEILAFGPRHEGDGELFSDRQAMLVGAAMTFFALVAIAVSIPYWHAIGVL